MSLIACRAQTDVCRENADVVQPRLFSPLSFENSAPISNNRAQHEVRASLLPLERATHPYTAPRHYCHPRGATDAHLASQPMRTGPSSRSNHREEEGCVDALALQASQRQRSAQRGVGPGPLHQRRPVICAHTRVWIHRSLKSSRGKKPAQCSRPVLIPHRACWASQRVSRQIKVVVACFDPTLLLTE